MIIIDCLADFSIHHCSLLIWSHHLSALINIFTKNLQIAILVYEHMMPDKFCYHGATLPIILFIYLSINLRVTMPYLYKWQLSVLSNKRNWQWSGVSHVGVQVGLKNSIPIDFILIIFDFGKSKSISIYENSDKNWIRIGMF